MKPGFDSYTLDYETPTDAALQMKLETIDANLRSKYDMTTEPTAAGVLDLRKLRLAMIHPDRVEYAASVPKIGILLAYFQRHPEAARDLNPKTRHELGLMVKASDNEMAAKFSREMGLEAIQQVLDLHGFYGKARGGGIWVGKHYGKGDERIGDPVGNHSHAATVRQLLRFYLLLEQGKLVSPAASLTMREIFASPDIQHDNIKFVKALEGRGVQVLRKWGSWQDWLHDTTTHSFSPLRVTVTFGARRSSLARGGITFSWRSRIIRKGMSIWSTSPRRWMILWSLITSDCCSCKPRKWSGNSSLRHGWYSSHAPNK